MQKNIVVTGSTSGIGWGIAHAFAKQKARIFLSGLEPENAVQNLLQEIHDISGIPPLYSNADLSTQEGVNALMDLALEKMGHIDVLVNNAGVQYKAAIEEFPYEKWRQILHLELEAAFLTSQRALPKMYEKKWGRLIHIASAHGLVASEHKAAYVAAKHGLVGLSKVIAIEAGGKGVTSNCICPGWVLTPLVKKQIEGMAQERGISMEKAQHELVDEKQPSKTFVTPEQIGQLALFLASDAAAQITGAALSIDGGWTAQ